ncbi:MAG: hypothetical protein ACRDAU_17495 [Clostridium sp.]
MLDYNLIKKMNSKNISIDTEKTKKRVKEIWKGINKEERDNAILIGGFSNSRSFNKTRKTGLISVRMTLAISVAKKINPFYITAEENNKNDYSEEKLIKFMESKNVKENFKVTEDSLIKNDLKEFFNNVLENINSEKIEEMNSLKKEEVITLIDGLFIKERLDEKKIKTLLIKIILTK